MAQKSFRNNAAMTFISGAEEAPAKDKTPAGNYEVPEGYRLVRESKTERLHLLIRPTTKAALKDAAAAAGVSVNDLANQIFEEYAERHGKE